MNQCTHDRVSSSSWSTSSHADWRVRAADALGLVEPVRRFGQRVVVGVGDGADGGSGADLVEALGEPDGGELGGFKWSSQHLDDGGVVDGDDARSGSGRCSCIGGRSRRRVRPTVAWREDRVRFWAAIARGAKTDDAAVEAGVSSPVGYRWFRHAGGVNPCLPPTVSGRYLSFSEREDIALLERKVTASERSRAGWAGARRRSPGSCAATRRPGPGGSSTSPRSRSGTQSVAPGGRRSRSSSTNDRLREYVQDRLAGAVSHTRRA